MLFFIKHLELWESSRSPWGGGLGRLGTAALRAEESWRQTSRTHPAASSSLQTHLTACVLPSAPADGCKERGSGVGYEQEEPCEGMGGCPGLGRDRARWGPSVKPPGHHCRHWGDSPPIVTCAVPKRELKLPLTECEEHLAKGSTSHSQHLCRWSGISANSTLPDRLHRQGLWTHSLSEAVTSSLYIEDGLDRRVGELALGYTAEFRASWLCGFLEATLVSNLSTSSKKGSRWPETQ